MHIPTVNLHEILLVTNWDIVAYVAASVAAFISLCHIIYHLFYFSMPQIQTYVVRILFICPIFAISSAIAIALGDRGQAVIVVRDIYETVVVYSFLNLILEYCGGETDCVYQIENEPPMKMPCPLCCIKPKPRNAKFMRFCCRGVLQFVIVKPIVSLIDLILIGVHQEHEFIWVNIRMILYNISYTFALYCLYVFYLATKSLIKHFRPVSKFAAVKVVIFATYYQSLFITIWAQQQHDKSYIQNAERFINILICLEMVIFSTCLVLAFPVSEFRGGMPDRRVLNNFKDVFTVQDVIQNMIHNFDPAYKDYALQRQQSEAPETGRLKTLFSGTTNAVAMEMTELYRGKSRRIAFNHLLRGDKPIQANLRPSNPMTLEYAQSSRRKGYRGSILSWRSPEKSQKKGQNTHEINDEEKGYHEERESYGYDEDEDDDEEKHSGLASEYSFQYDTSLDSPLSHTCRSPIHRHNTHTDTDNMVEIDLNKESNADNSTVIPEYKTTAEKKTSILFSSTFFQKKIKCTKSKDTSDKTSKENQNPNNLIGPPNSSNLAPPQKKYTHIIPNVSSCEEDTESHVSESESSTISHPYKMYIQDNQIAVTCLPVHEQILYTSSADTSHIVPKNSVTSCKVTENSSNSGSGKGSHNGLLSRSDKSNQNTDVPQANSNLLSDKDMNRKKTHKKNRNGITTTTTNSMSPLYSTSSHNAFNRPDTSVYHINHSSEDMDEETKMITPLLPPPSLPPSSAPSSSSSTATNTTATNTTTTKLTTVNQANIKRSISSLSPSRSHVSSSSSSSSIIQKIDRYDDITTVTSPIHDFYDNTMNNMQNTKIDNIKSQSTSGNDSTTHAPITTSNESSSTYISSQVPISHTNNQTTTSTTTTASTPNIIYSNSGGCGSSKKSKDEVEEEDPEIWSDFISTA